MNYSIFRPQIIPRTIVGVTLGVLVCLYALAAFFGSPNRTLPREVFVFQGVPQIAADVDGVGIPGARAVVGDSANAQFERGDFRNPIPLGPVAPLPRGVGDHEFRLSLAPHAHQYASLLFTGAETTALLTQVQPAVNIAAPVAKGRLGAYIPITSAATPNGFHPDFAKFGGWGGQEVDQTRRLRDGKYTTALVWRPHGMRANGHMPVDAMLYLSATSADPIERAAADERAFVDYLRALKTVLDENAGGPGKGELWVYLGNFEQAGVGEIPMRSRQKAERDERLRRVLHPLKVAGVDGVAIDASGPATKGSIEENAAQLILAEGFRFVGYEGWAEKRISGSLAAWTTDPRMTGFLMGYWSSDAPQLYPERSGVRGKLAYINSGVLGKREAATKDADRKAFISRQTAAGIDVYEDVYWATSPNGVTPAKGY